MTPSLFESASPASDTSPKPEDFNDIKRWQPLPPVQPEIDNQPWKMERIPSCIYDIRKWAGKKRPDIYVTCSGPAEHWLDRPGHPYGYCAYHWVLRQYRQLFAGNVATNPNHTPKERAHDQAIVDQFWEQREKQGLPSR
jgi:hypothetical protein